ncbi:MAG: hypothetical protein AAGK38_04485 [Pseudomonadota bacterium]
MTYTTKTKKITLAGAGFGALALMAAHQTAWAEQAVRAPLPADAAVSKLVTGSVAKSKLVIPELRYSSRVTKEGKIAVTLDENNPQQGNEKRDVLTVFAPNVRATEVLLHSQDWYLTVDASGAMRGIYTVPRNNALPSSVLRSLGDGHGILKVNPAASFFKIFPSKGQLGVQLQAFTNGARDAVCKTSNKPETLSASVDVKPGWSGAGRIRFDATWKVSELCKAPKAASAKDVKTVSGG